MTKHTGLHDVFNNLYLDILDDTQVVREDVNILEHLREMVLARGEAGERLKRKKNKTKNHGASDQFRLITRLHNSKMAANTRNYYHVIEMAAYKIDNNFWREKHVKMDSGLLPEIDKKKIVHWTMGCLEQRTNLWEGSKYGNIVKIQNENGEYPTCQNVGGQNTKKIPQKRTYR